MPLRIFDVAIKPLLLRGVSPTSYNLSLVVGVPLIYANPIYGNNWWIEITENLRYRLPRRGGAQVEYLPLGRILAKSLFRAFLYRISFYFPAIFIDSQLGEICPGIVVAQKLAVLYQYIPSGYLHASRAENYSNLGQSVGLQQLEIPMKSFSHTAF
jgi:hypothetical protein